MKAISFLGFNKRGYQETTYLNPIASGEYKTKFIQEALVEFYKPETLYVLLTNTAATGIPDNETESSWETLNKKLFHKVDLRAIENVPEGHSTSDIWKLFELLTDCLQEGDRVLFDITNGFRSLPVLALIAVSYLRVVRQVQIEGLIYGAFDAKTNDNKTPIFDLLPIVSLLEWTTATDQFTKTGNGQALANLLYHGDSTAQNLAASIQGIAQGLQLLRPMDVIQEAAILPERITAAEPTVSQTVPPFAALLKRVEKDYGNFGLVNPTDYRNYPQSSLLRQLKIVEWYAAKGQIVQALSMAREWLPSLLCHHFQLDPLDKPCRDEMELLLNGGKDKDKKESRYLEQWSTIPKEKKKPLSRLWCGELNLAKLRNDVLHAGFRKDPKSAEDILHQTELIIKELQAIAKVWDLQDETV
ncbi:TIGR02221 family CRISPR-associated protein [Umezakia ovalisporum]|jgi:CRISPR-associated Csx2 family protein|uniref:TIGR02221 family CRISPR-associated protein n=1 Tax=Umezakia ovalisporum FSS-43 TaxID=2740520 RepID=A0ABT6K0T3_9CYAN|nr:TIGR02221 family CRISPR-associated protein [Umezakia ovalisporum]MDH6055967.1 TIGR02221 family CRISPR-associated protein [Umezakia ovalisporum FSS-43]MDH6072599.1 TIGR02221 family CRISPR-associated protein [Umezakia ovalisporum CobakiLakeA]MDH6081389.1 TIGR02221 family CRISPR-associated protein [Umezakia ovalisporum FSS-44]MDH6087090.1 TIGR02221 family CRISPR-associated protein [Umezakia ovalisporum Ak1311]MDH6094909.1 TIGR02221 family CRISPR-associated protein [Umezakia ovalisporum CobakiL